MIINPKKALERGWLKAVKGCPKIDEKKQLQQNGIDLRVKSMLSISANQNLAGDPVYNPKNAYEGFCFVRRGIAVAIDSMEYVNVPEKVVAMVVHRSSFNRRGIFVTGSVYDSGFRGNVGSTMYPFVDMPIKNIDFFNISCSSLPNFKSVGLFSKK